MFPTLRVFGITLPTYGVLYVIAFGAALWLVGPLAKREGLDATRMRAFGLYCVLVVRPAAVLMDALVTGSRVSLVGFVQSTGAFFWVFISGLTFAIAYSGYYGIPLLKFLDCLSPPIVLAQAIGRLGCFAAGCCFGTPTASAFGVVYTDARAQGITNVPLNVTLHPTQLYESAGAVLILTGLLWLYPRRVFSGQVFTVMLGAISTARLIFESFRGDAARSFVFDGLSVPRLIAVVLLVVAVVLYFRLRPRASLSRDSD